ncbi:hypothetical protein MC885_010454 [Smutsia gigantea]|nr:hypothetical protein MC885_010454 [Smutsia gigantea]
MSQASDKSNTTGPQTAEGQRAASQLPSRSGRPRSSRQADWSIQPEQAGPEATPGRSWRPLAQVPGS